MSHDVRTDTGPFAVIPEWLLDDLAVSHGAVRLYGILARHADKGTGEAIPSRTRLAKRLGCSVDTIDRWTRELEEAGGLEVAPRFDDAGDRTSNLYTIHRVRRGSRTDAVTGGGTDAATGSRTDAAVNESHPERESVELDAEPALGADEPDPGSAEKPTRRSRTVLDEIKREADEVAREWWEGTNPRPSFPGGFPAARKRIEEFMRRPGDPPWSSDEMRAALPTWSSWTNGQLERELRRRRYVREAHEEQSERQLLEQYGTNPNAWLGQDDETKRRLRKALARLNARRAP